MASKAKAHAKADAKAKAKAKGGHCPLLSSQHALVCALSLSLSLSPSVSLSLLWCSLHHVLLHWDGICNAQAKAPVSRNMQRQRLLQKLHLEKVHIACYEFFHVHVRCWAARSRSPAFGFVWCSLHLWQHDIAQLTVSHARCTKSSCGAAAG